MESYNSIVGFFQNGGLFMYPIALVLAVGVAIAIERVLFLLKLGKTNKDLWSKIDPMLERGQIQQIEQSLVNSKSPVGTIFSNGLKKAQTNSGSEAVEMAMEEGFLKIMPLLHKRTHYLATFANIATLLGLLGTIMGLIDAFTAVSKADPVQKADLLSSSISVAMNTTAFGLMVAIPLLLVYSWLQTRTNEMVEAIEHLSVKFYNRLVS